MEVCVITEGFGVAVNLSTISLTAQGISLYCEFIVLLANVKKVLKQHVVAPGCHIQLTIHLSAE